MPMTMAIGMELHKIRKPGGNRRRRGKNTASQERYGSKGYSVRESYDSTKNMAARATARKRATVAQERYGGII